MAQSGQCLVQTDCFGGSLLVKRTKQKGCKSELTALEAQTGWRGRIVLSRRPVFVGYFDDEKAAANP
jgi:hypothetical protein